MVAQLPTLAAPDEFADNDDNHGDDDDDTMVCSGSLGIRTCWVSNHGIGKYAFGTNGILGYGLGHS